MTRKKVKSAQPNANGETSSRAMYRSRTRNRTGLLYHRRVSRLAGCTTRKLLIGLAMFGVAALATERPDAAGPVDRLDQFRELARSRASGEPVDADASPDAYREMYALLDEDIVESLSTGGLYASAGFLQDRLDTFGEAWGAAAVDVVWSTSDVFPQGLMARTYSVRRDEIRVRYEPDYRGRTPGCEGQTEAEDVFRAAPESGTLVRRAGRQLNAWHRELRATVAQLFDALASGDESSLAKLVPDIQIRRRLPSTLRPEAACDAADGAAYPVTVSVAATAEHTPWALTFQRGGARWRLAAAGPVLE